MDVSPPPQADDPIITQFRPVQHQWELNDENINRIDPETGRSILHNYCRYINTTPLEVWRYLIETKCCDVNTQDNSKDTPLHDAILFFDPNKGGDITVLTYLLSQKDVNGNIVGEYGYTLLHWACNNINRLPLEIFKLLIETLGGDVNAQANNKDTPIHRALVRFPRNGDISVLQYLFNQTNVDANTKGQYDSTILHIACEEVNALPIDIFKVLIETAGCDVNAQDKYNDTPLHVAFRYFDPNKGGDITALAYLINQKTVNVNNKYTKGCNLLHSACIINLSTTWDPAKKNAECDTILCQIVELIAERCVQEVLEETIPLEAATTTM